MMNLHLKKTILSFISYLYLTSGVTAQNVTVDLSSEKQEIRGFGGMNCPAWGVDLTADQRTTAFGNGPGQLGMTILRIMVTESSNSWSRELPTARRAVELGAIVFACPWNPPSGMISNRHVKPSSYGEYADHLNSFVNYMKNNGVDLYAISVQNEPDYGDWTQWSAQEIVTFLKQNVSVIQTRVMAPESFQYRKSMSDPILNDPAALAELDILGAHLYGTPVRDMPYPLFKQKGAGKELWMTEHYTDSNNDADLWPNALNVATDIHNCMVEGEFNAYVWWYIRRSYGMLKENGQISKRGYCMAHFCKFIRPGAKRVEATKSPISGVYVSAYKSKGNDSLIIVAVNTATSSKSLNIAIKGGSVTSFVKYTTSGSRSLAADGTVNVSNASFSGTIDAQSVSTWVGKLTDVAVVKLGYVLKKGGVPVPEQNRSVFRIFDIRGRVPDVRPESIKKVDSFAVRPGVYFIRDEKTGIIAYVKIIR